MEASDGKEISDQEKSNFERVHDYQRIAKENGDRIILNPEIAIDHLTFDKAVLSKEDILRYANSHSYGDKQLWEVYENIVNSDKIIKLGKDDNGIERFTSKEMLNAEQEMFRNAIQLSYDYNHKIEESYIFQTIKNYSMSEYQLDAFRHIVNGSDICSVVGYAGSGKSYMIGAVREAYEAQGYDVKGVALSGISAEGLRESSGINSRTIHSQLLAWKNGRKTLTKNSVLVVDEAGMVGTRLMHELLSHVKKANAKIILVGDIQQLQAIEAGGPFRGLIERTGYFELTEIRRQDKDWQKQATIHLSGEKDDIEKAIQAYHDNGNIKFSEDFEKSKTNLIEDWTRNIYAQSTDRIILAYRNKDVSELNLLAREELKNAGLIDNIDHAILTNKGIRQFAIKDRVMFLENNYSMGVRNGSLGTIRNIQKDFISVRLDNGTEIVFDYHDEYNNFDHGYAATVHKTQGVTVDNSYILGSRHFDKHLAYVSMTRHREDVNLYVSHDEYLGFKNLNTLKNILSTSREKDLVMDYAIPRNIFKESFFEKSLRMYQESDGLFPTVKNILNDGKDRLQSIFSRDKNKSNLEENKFSDEKLNVNKSFDHLTDKEAVFPEKDISKQKNTHSIKSSSDLVSLKDGKYTYSKMLETETKMFEIAARLSKKFHHPVSKNISQKAIQARTLTLTQQKAYDYVLNSGSVSVIVGYAGSGKSYMMGALKDAYESQGYDVKGAALSGIAAEGLQTSTGIISRTIFSQLAAIEKNPNELNKNSVLLIDEAGMIGTRQLTEILKHARNADAKVILVGDNKQIQSIEAGGALRGIMEHVGFAELDEVRRQNVKWQKEATVHLSGREGDAEKAFEAYHSHGNIHFSRDFDESKEALIKDWSANLKDDKSDKIILAYRNVDVHDLNALAREKMEDAGLLGKDKIIINVEKPDYIKKTEGFGLKVDNIVDKSKGERIFSTGDRIIFLKNDDTLEIKNGSIGTLKHTHGGVFHVALDNGKDIVFSPHNFKYFDHGYATTIHKSQGMTVDNSYVLGTRHLDKNLSYVAMTRHREKVNLYVSNDKKMGFSGINHLKKSMSTLHEKELIKDYLEPKGTPSVQRDNATEKQFERYCDLVGKQYQSQAYFSDHKVSISMNDKRFQGKILYEQPSGDIALPHTNEKGVCGVEILVKNRDYEKEYLQGSKKGLWISNCFKNDTKLVITNRPLDAVSYHEIKKEGLKTRYVCIDEDLPKVQTKLIERMTQKLNPGAEIIIATHPENSKKIKSFVSSHGHKVTIDCPENGKNWNEELRHHKTLVQEQNKQQGKDNGLSR